jgi:hypothetical protein
MRLPSFTQVMGPSGARLQAGGEVVSLAQRGLI